MTKYCITCKTDTTKDPTNAAFNFAGQKPLYCGKHKQEGMINLNKKHCNCILHKQAYFNYPDKQKPEYCDGCKLQGMVNVVSKKCIDCNKDKPSFNVEGEITALYCYKCSLKYNNMVNVNNKKCAYKFDDGKYCTRAPNFNLPGEKGGVYCSEHKPNDKYIDVIHPKCMYKGEQCRNSPGYNYKGEKRVLFCSEHALNGMIDVKHPLCKLCDYVYIQNINDYEDMCFSCFAFTYPEQTKITNFLVKERFIVDYLKTTWPQYTWKYNKFLNNCAKYRPDLLLDMGTHVVIIEIDEHQHNTKLYKECDLKRTYDILAELARPLIMLRINPDEYVSDNGTKYNPIFKKVKRKLVLDEDEWKSRQHVINDIFQKCIEIPNELFTNIELFFDVSPKVNI